MAAKNATCGFQKPELRSLADDPGREGDFPDPLDFVCVKFREGETLCAKVLERRADEIKFPTINDEESVPGCRLLRWFRLRGDLPCSEIRITESGEKANVFRGS